MSHILLIGFMGAGKSTVGRILAKDLGLEFIDLDSMVEAAEGRSVRSIFEDEGESRFRALESEALATLATRARAVVACGGGVVLAEANRSTLKRLGTVVYLKVTAAETVARVGGDESRPLLAGAEPHVVADGILSAREELYSATADITVDTVGETPKDVAKMIAQQVSEWRFR